LSVVAARDPATLPRKSDDDPSVAPVRFRMHANYGAFIDRAEVRLFAAEQSVQSTPLDVVAVDPSGFAEYQPPRVSSARAATRELKYVLRVYDKDGQFDETRPQALWLADGAARSGAPTQAAADAGEVRNDLAAEVDTDSGVEALLGQESVLEGAADESTQPAESAAVDQAAAAKREALRNDPELLAGYGENGLSIRSLQSGGGTVTVQGSGIPAGHSVWIAGRSIPVDGDGNFVAEEILPAGLHTVEVAVLDEAGNGELFLRDLEFKRSDLFYVGIADLTVSESRTRGPADLMQGGNAPYDNDSSLDGRLAFYLDHKFRDRWRLTASADTREGPVKDLFSNFLDKSPESLFRRIDPDNHYPTFGDDSTVEETAPTLGKFFVKLSRNADYALWGNFKVGYLANELAHVDRGLYGATAHYQSEATTSFGEQRYALDGFAAEPGTLPGREEFRGTGGSLYFLRRQDVLAGSERVRVELRDKDSGIVTGVVNLKPVLDYDVDYLQGRILLSEPLSSTTDDKLLVRSGSLSGDDAYLVVRYEYTPGFESLAAMSTGAQAHYWFNDFVKLGLTVNSNEEGDTDSLLGATDLTVRKGAETWVKVQASQSEGLLSGASYSNDGGFDFFDDEPLLSSDSSAGAYRADASLGLGDVFDGGKGRLTLYSQSLDAGYSAPGLTTARQTDNLGGSFQMPVTQRLHVRAKADSKVQEQGLEVEAREINVGYRLGERWDLSIGARNDFRQDRSASVPLTQEQGERTDAVVQVAYDSTGRWRAYAFAQDTLSATGDRQDNARMGSGGSFRVTDKFRPGGRRQARDELPLFRPYEPLRELCARERADRQRAARARRQPGLWRQAEAVGQLQRLPGGALPGHGLGYGSDARNRCQPGAQRPLELRRQHGDRAVH
jgi:hypothetical protein